jgi:hypothetical protein
LKVQKIEEKRDFHGFLRQNTVFSKALAIFFVSQKKIIEKKSPGPKTLPTSTRF